MSRYEDDEAEWQEDTRPRWWRRRRSSDAPRMSGWRRASAIMASVVALALVCGSLFLYVRYRQIWDSVEHVGVSGDLRGTKRPPEDKNAMNILLIGSDSRSGVNGKIGGHDNISGARSDTVMVMHISPGAHRAVVLSFPRDSVVPILACTPEDGAAGQTAQPGAVEQINTTFADGGPGCLWKTIESTTHIRINDFIQLTFIGFEKVINDLGGVNVCLPKAVNDPMSRLHLAAGIHHVWGREALAWWRTREDLGEGSDLQRIQRDQFLMASLLQGIEKSGLLKSPTKMLKVVADAARHMSTNIGDVSTMVRIAEGMRGLSSKGVQFIEVPSVTYSGNVDWVQWSAGDSALFAAIEHDTKLPTKVKKTGGKTAQVGTADGTDGSGTTLPALNPSQIQVEVLNGTGQTNQAAEGAADLTSRGFDVLGSTDAPTFGYTDSMIEYHGPADLRAAETLKAEVPDVVIRRMASVPKGTIDLVLGSTFTELKTPSASSASSGKSGSSTANLTKTFGGIRGNVNVCQDTSAFAGPDGS
jgi:LCP family protein required for cell wall assembly